MIQEKLASKKNPKLYFSPKFEKARSVLRATILTLLVWLPVPVGSNRGWSNSLFVLVIATISLVNIIYWLRHYRGQAIFAASSKPRNSIAYAANSNTAGMAFSNRALAMLCLLGLTQIWVMLQWLMGLSADSGETFRYLLTGIAYTLLFWLIVDLFNSRSSLTLLLATLVISGTLQAFYGTLMTLSGIEWLIVSPKEYGKGVVTGTFVNRNHMAGYLEICLACGVGLMLAKRSHTAFNWRDLIDVLLSPKTQTRIALAIMVIGLVMTRSRMGNTAFFSSLLIAGTLFIIAHRQHRWRNALVLASIIAIDILIISQYFGLDNLRNRLIDTQLEDKIVAGEVVHRENVDRDDVARYVVVMYQERPLTGFGAGSFEASFQQYAGPDIPLDFDHAHNDILQFATELGLIGTVPLALFVILALYHALKAMWKRDSLFYSGVGLGATMGILAITIHSFADFNLQIPANAATFVCLCAIACLANKSSHTD